ncbi:ABC transporter ATP-binding protein [Leucobacter sp. HNU]|uniref:ABC transporter ATP-binding protein n=1 Tax=Leucobacter sp. HNU TaxID=3236805 RepID=UPI003A7F9C2A
MSRTGTPGHDLPAVAVHGLGKQYGGRAILDGVDLEIGRGETYALLGPNGAGKSTTIEILEGFRTSGAGTVEVLGHDPAKAGRAWRSRIGIVPQTTAEFGPYTPRELLAHHRRFAPNPRGVDEVLDLVGLTAQARIRAPKLSGGQQRRLDVALGIIGGPELVFLDEPTTGFDPEARRQFWSMLEGLTATGTTILLTTHYLDEAERLADRVGVLSGGRIVAEAPPAELGGIEQRTPIVRWREDGRVLERRTERPGELIARLVAAADGEPDGLEVIRPSLEDVYLGLIGAFRTGDAEEAEDAEDPAGSAAPIGTASQEAGA